MAPRKKATALIEQVAKNIKHYRMKNKLTQEQIEDMCGIRVYRYESGKYDMNLSTINTLSKYLRVKPYQLLE